LGITVNNQHIWRRGVSRIGRGAPLWGNPTYRWRRITANPREPKNDARLVFLREEKSLRHFLFQWRLAGMNGIVNPAKWMYSSGYVGIEIFYKNLDIKKSGVFPHAMIALPV